MDTKSLLNSASFLFWNFDERAFKDLVTDVSVWNKYVSTVMFYLLNLYCIMF